MTGPVAPVRPGPRRGGLAALAPSHRDGLALVLSSGLTSVVGMLYWVVAARLVPPAELGLNQVALSTMMFLGGLAQLNLSYALLRFVPVAGRAARRLVGGSYTVVAGTSVLVGAVFALGAPLWAPQLVEAFGLVRLLLFFLVATPLWAIFTVQDFVLTGIRRATIVPVENVLFSVLKIGLLAAVTVVVLPGGVAVSWVVATGIIVLVINGWLFGRGLPAHGRAAAERAVPVTAGAVARFVRADYAGGILWQAAQFGLPLIVLARLGAEQAAVYGIVWTIAQALYLVAAGMAQSMVAHSAVDLDGTDAARRQMVRRALTLVVPAVAVLALGAPWVLALFGPRYAHDGEAVLVLTALSAIPNVITAAEIAAARVRQRVLVQFGVPSAIAVVVIGLAWALLPRLGVTAVGLAWLLGQVVVAAGIRIATAPWLPPVLRRPVTALRAAALLRRVQDVAEAEAGGPCVLGARLSGGSDTVVVSVEPTPDGPRTVLKTSDSTQGRVQLRRQTDVLRTLHADERLGVWRKLLPGVVGDADARGAYTVLETRMPGAGGAAALLDPARSALFRASAVDAITELHRRTADLVVAGSSELDAWVHEPMTAVTAALPRRARPQARRMADLLADRVRGRLVAVAWTHGDYTPENVLSDPDGRVSGIVDWGQSRRDGLAVLDVVTFSLTAQRTSGGEEMGAVVLHRIVEPSPAEDDLLLRAQQTTGGRSLDPTTLTLLGWLQHVAQNLSKSGAFAANPVWVRRNLVAVVRGALPALDTADRVLQRQR
ncbi:phosphotransferase [Pseudonocardia sp.]|uniref:phosphotransferase n=1 Tax=Pseudonocardia sp. TaxID=60912 RepID=UPI00263069CB|nr:phosphotransferase [Pseudonocardia sp.]MCW2716429.1 hypothetical protein [Pseudonocardia sp.]